MKKLVFTRQMGFSRAEFDRILPSALDQRPFDANGNMITVALDGGTMMMVVSEQKARKIASLSLPFLDIEFTFERLSEAQVDTIMRYFELRYQRGGG